MKSTRQSATWRHVPATENDNRLAYRRGQVLWPSLGKGKSSARRAMKTITALINGLDWLNLKILWLCKWLTIFLVGALAVNVFIGVFFRYVLNDSLAWYEESSKYMMIWLVFSGAPIVLKQRGHIALDVITKRLAPRLQNANYLIVYTIVLFLVCIFVWQGFDLAWRARGQTATTMDLSFFWVYLSIPLGCTIMALISLEFWLSALRGIFRPEESDLGAGDVFDNSLS